MPFLRPKAGARFAGDLFNAAGGPYAMSRRDADAFAAPYEDPAASAAIAAIMGQLDFPALLRQVDDGFCSWRQPSLLLFGTSGAPVGAERGARWLRYQECVCVCVFTSV